MFTRSEAEAREGHILLDLCLGDDAPYGFVDFLTGALDGEPDPAASPGPP